MLCDVALAEARWILAQPGAREVGSGLFYAEQVRMWQVTEVHHQRSSQRPGLVRGRPLALQVMCHAASTRASAPMAMLAHRGVPPHIAMHSVVGSGV